MKEFISRNKTRITAIVVILVLLSCAAYSFTVDYFDTDNQKAWVYIILTNPYVSGIVYTLGLLYIVYAIQIDRSKRRIKRDFRCNEVMEDVDHSISEFNELISSKNADDSYKDFIIQHKTKLSVVKLGLTYFNNNILIESLKRCFFINLNFELLAIINNLENRLPNITDEKKSVSSFLELGNNSEATFEENDAKYYLMDLKYLAGYWRALLNYLEYDNLYSKELAKYYHRYFEKEDFKSIKDMSLRIEMIQKAFNGEIKRKVREAKRKGIR